MLVGNVVSKFKSNSLKISNLDTLKAVPCRNFERASIKRKNENNVTHFVTNVQGVFFNWAHPLDWAPPKMLRLAPPQTF